VPDSDSEFARLLRVLRLHAGHPSDREIADRSGLSHTIVGNAHRGVQIPSWESAVLIIKALEGDPADLRAGWEIATSGRPAGPRERLGGAIRELQLWAKMDSRRLGAVLDSLAPDMLAGGMIPGLPPLSEYVTGIDHGRTAVWHVIAGCQKSFIFTDAGGLVTWVLAHHREEHPDDP
jgi:hypothetical protein